MKTIIAKIVYALWLIGWTVLVVITYTCGDDLVVWKWRLLGDALSTVKLLINIFWWSNMITLPMLLVMNNEFGEPQRKREEAYLKWLKREGPMP